MRRSVFVLIVLFAACAFAQDNASKSGDPKFGGSEDLSISRSQDLMIAGLQDPKATVPSNSATQSSTTAPTSNTSQQDQQQKPPEPPPNGAVTNPAATSTREANKEVPKPLQQPKRILGIMPNYRAVSAGALPPPPTPKQAFKLATQNSFDYSSFVFVGLTSAIAEGEDTHKSFGKGMEGFGRYYWRGFVDKTDGNYLVIFALPTVLHEDERYYALGKGGFWKRAAYSTSRVLITPNYHGHNTMNLSELLGRGAAQAISTTYYPSTDNTASKVLTKYAFALVRDASTNAFREFWPDISSRIFRKKQ